MVNRENMQEEILREWLKLKKSVRFIQFLGLHSPTNSFLHIHITNPNIFQELNNKNKGSYYWARIRQLYLDNKVKYSA